ncbi:MAG: phytanoyl-CoA dioxygenase family protein, partial [Tagaea sp.]
LACVLRHPGVVRSLSTILGDDYLLCDEFGVHADFYTSGWHCDTSSPSNAGHDFFWDPNFNVVQVAIYLQPNDPSSGGGLDVIPGSHMSDDPFCIQRIWLLPHEAPPPALDTGFSARVARRLRRYAVAARSRGLPIPGVRPDDRTQALSRAETVLSGAGDLLAFNLRLGHRSTPAHPGARGKRALFFVCGANNRATRAYGDWNDRYHAEKRRKPCPRDEYIAGFKPAARPAPLAPRGDEGPNG